MHLLKFYFENVFLVTNLSILILMELPSHTHVVLQEQLRHEKQLPELNRR